jgi:putative endonuclease
VGGGDETAAGCDKAALRELGAVRDRRATKEGLASPAVSDDLRHRLGKAGERAAVAHLRRLGYDVIGRNHRTRFGELDVIAFDGETIVFCEVKTRRAGPASSPWDGLDPLKRDQVRRMAAAWLAETSDRPYSAELRFDAIGVTFDGCGTLVALEHLEGAF